MTKILPHVQGLFDAGHANEITTLFEDPRIPPGQEFRSAAVLIAFTDKDDPGLLLLHRPSDMRAHPGQIAFPGGKIDPGETPVKAALREAWEELGINSSKVEVVGPSDLYRTGSGYEITPVVGVVPPDIQITPNPAEVAQWFEAPARFVLDPVNHVERFVEWEGKPTPYFEIAWQNHIIWGVTAALIVNLSRRLNWHG